MDGLQIQWALAPGTVDMPARLRGFLGRLLRDISAAPGSNRPSERPCRR